MMDHTALIKKPMDMRNISNIVKNETTALMSRMRMQDGGTAVFLLSTLRREDSLFQSS